MEFRCWRASSCQERGHSDVSIVKHSTTHSFPLRQLKKKDRCFCLIYLWLYQMYRHVACRHCSWLERWISEVDCKGRVEADCESFCLVFHRNCNKPVNRATLSSLTKTISVHSQLVFVWKWKAFCFQPHRSNIYFYGHKFSASRHIRLSELLPTKTFEEPHLCHIDFSGL